jgi:hypothetical protein
VLRRQHLLAKLGPHAFVRTYIVNDSRSESNIPQARKVDEMVRVPTATPGADDPRVIGQHQPGDAPTAQLGPNKAA